MSSRAATTSVGTDRLLDLGRRGIEHPLIPLRLRFADLDQLRKLVVLPLHGVERIYPDFLPTQASGRWSITHPPLTTLSARCLNPECPRQPEEHPASRDPCWSARDSLIPDPGEYWLGWDWDGIEGRIMACYSHAPLDLAAYRKGWDLHTLRTCRVFTFREPEDKVNPHTSPVDQGWRDSIQWGGKDDRRRVVTKTASYALQYALSYRGVLEAKGWQEAGLTRDELLNTARALVRAQPEVWAWKRRTWETMWKTHRARTRSGRLRRLHGDYEDVIKQGLNDLIQGEVADLMNRCLIDADARWPESTLVYQSHDGAKIAFPAHARPWPAIKTMIERQDVLAGEPMTFTATWQLVDDGGRHWAPGDFFAALDGAPRPIVP